VPFLAQLAWHLAQLAAFEPCRAVLAGKGLKRL